jgi:hypothetical protein
MSKFTNSYKIRRRIAEMAGKRQPYQKKHGKPSPNIQGASLKSRLQLMHRRTM